MGIFMNLLSKIYQRFQLNKNFSVGFSVLGVLAVTTLAQPALADTINIYSHRQQVLIQPFLDAFTDKTGIKTKIVYASKGLAQRLKAEGAASPADVVLTVDIARLSEYADLDLLASVQSEILNENIPANRRSEDGRWYGLSERARIVVTSRDRVEDGEITRIEDLSEPKWKGRICSRPGSHVYNRSLLASLIAAHGETKAAAWAEDLVGNLARKPQGNDRAQAKAIFQGVCDVAIMNSYYYGNMLFGEKEEQREWADAIRLVFTNQADRGNHINVSGAGVAKHSKNKKSAVAFLEFLTTEPAQKLYGDINFEYPVNPQISVEGAIANWGDFKRDSLPIETLAELAPAAQRIIDRSGW